MTRRFGFGDVAPRIDLLTIRGERVHVPSIEGRVVHLQFRRYAGCLLCNLHLRSVVRRVGEIEKAGVHAMVVFHSSVETMREHYDDLPLDVIADPEK